MKESIRMMEEEYDEDQGSLFVDASDDFPFYDSSLFLDSIFYPCSLPPSPEPQTSSSEIVEPTISHHPLNHFHFEPQTSPDPSHPQPSTQTQTQTQTHLLNVAEFIVKAIAYQFNLLITILTFPFWLLYYTCIFAFNPFYLLRLAKSFLFVNFNKLSHTFKPYLTACLNHHTPCFDFALRCAWGLLWSIYVSIVLITLFISSFLIAGLMMRYYVVEEPFQLKHPLNFDYTTTKPVAYVPIILCPNHNDKDDSEADNGNANVAALFRVIPPNHKLHTTLTMVLPESDYNRNLGIFQVKVEFVSENGKSLGTFRHPCMLEFKSQPLRLLLTFFKIVPLVAGYLSETQTLKLSFRGYTEGVIPTACLKITMEQRAEFRPGAGIPEVYDAFVHVESELPFFRRILWYWRRTIFVWLSLTVFSMELFFALICCTPAIIPRTRSRSNVVTRSNPTLTTQSVQS